MTGYVEAPEEYDGGAPSVFLAGGITGVPDWQRYAAERLTGHAVVLNPRRARFRLNDDAAHAEQVRWEHAHLARATVVMFWFPAVEVQPIALLELGAFAYAGLGAKHIVLGVDPAYPRCTDVHLQMGCARPDLELHDDLDRTIARTISVLRTL
jgi:hypothetical protein